MCREGTGPLSAKNHHLRRCDYKSDDPMRDTLTLFCTLEKQNIHEQGTEFHQVQRWLGVGLKITQKSPKGCKPQRSEVPSGGGCRRQWAERRGDLSLLRNRIIDNQGVYKKAVVLEVQETMRNTFTSVPEASLVVRKPLYAENAHLQFITGQGNSNIIWQNTIVSSVHRHDLTTGRPAHSDACHSHKRPMR